MSNESCVKWGTGSNDYTQLFGVQLFFSSAYVIVFAIGLVGNLCVIAAIGRNPGLKTVRNFFILNLSCSDISVISFSGSVTLVTTLKKEWYFGRILCFVFPLFQGMSLFISIFTLTCIALDRYRLICHPTKRPITGRQALLMILAVWILAIGFSIPTVLHQRYGPYDNNNQTFCGIYCVENWEQHGKLKTIYGWTLLTFQFVIPFIIMAVCYYFILNRVSHGILLRAAEQTPKSEQSRAQKSALKHNSRTNRMLISMVVVFAISWLPSVILNVIADLELVVLKQEYFVRLIIHFIAMTSTVWNPILYAGLNEQYRRAFIEIIPCCGTLLLRRQQQQKPSPNHSDLVIENKSTEPPPLDVSTPLLVNHNHNDGFNDVQL